MFQFSRLPKKKSLSPRHRKFTGLLYWLSREKDIESALERLLNVIPAKERDLVRSKLDVAMKIYKLDLLDNSTYKYLDNDSLLNEVTRNIFNDSILSEKINARFLKEYNRCLYPSWLLDIVLNRQIFLPCQVEDKDQPSSHDFAESILQLICEIVIAFEKEKITDEQNVLIKLVGRDSNKCVNKTIKCNNNNISNFSELDAMETFDRQKILLRALEIADEQHNVILNCDSDLKLFFLCISFWCSDQRNQCFSKPNQAELGAVLAMVTLYKCDISSDFNDEKLSSIKRLFSLNQELRTNKKIFDITSVQSFGNLQTSLMYTIILNRLLGFPMEEPPIQLMWNSTFLYNASNIFTDIEEVKSFFSLKAFDDYLDVCAIYVPNYNQLKSNVNIRKRRKPKNRRNTSRSGHEDICKGEAVDTGTYDNQATTIEYEDLHNKFSLLAMA